MFYTMVEAMVLETYNHLMLGLLPMKESMDMVFVETFYRETNLKPLIYMDLSFRQWQVMFQDKRLIFKLKSLLITMAGSSFAYAEIQMVG